MDERQRTRSFDSFLFDVQVKLTFDFLKPCHHKQRVLCSKFSEIVHPFNRLFSLKLLKQQVRDLLDHEDSPYIRAV